MVKRNFVVKIPNEWEEELEGSVYTFYDPRGNGPVQISIKPLNNKKIDLIETLTRSAKVRGITIMERENFVETAFLRDSSFWKMKIVKSSKYVAFITYNCYADNIDEVEISSVTKIFASFKFITSGK